MSSYTFFISIDAAPKRLNFAESGDKNSVKSYSKLWLQVLHFFDSFICDRNLNEYLLLANLNITDVLELVCFNILESKMPKDVFFVKSKFFVAVAQFFDGFLQDEIWKPSFFWLT